MENAGGYVDFPEITARKIKAAVIANKRAVEFYQTDPSDSNDLDTSSYIYSFDDVDLPDH